MAAMENWMNKLKSAEKTCLVQDGKRKVHYTFPDKSEMAEEYSVQTDELLVRKWRKKNILGAVQPWEYEVGANQEKLPVQSDLMLESSSNPIFTRQDTKSAFQWRIRNMIYPSDNYLVELLDKQYIVVKTQNKKYYKKFDIPDLCRVNIGLEANNLKFTHKNNTLIITYEKPSEFLKLEKLIQQELSKSKASKEGDVECNPS